MYRWVGVVHIIHFSGASARCFEARAVTLLIRSTALKSGPRPVGRSPIATTTSAGGGQLDDAYYDENHRGPGPRRSRLGRAQRDVPRRSVIDSIFARLPVKPPVAIDTSSLAMLVDSDCTAPLSRSQIREA
jgi:hypothetical protein